ncbi:uncharacterized protein LOC144713083 [Wolffia australiana]
MNSAMEEIESSKKICGNLWIAGVWSGVLEDIPLESWTIAALREEIWIRSGGNGSPDDIRLISGGHVLIDGSNPNLEMRNLMVAGLLRGAKILATAGSAELQRRRKATAEDKLAQETDCNAEPLQSLFKFRSTAKWMACRNASDSFFPRDLRIEIEIRGRTMARFIKETDQRSVIFALILHINAKKLMKIGFYRYALVSLNMSAAAISCCGNRALPLMCNVVERKVDYAWCLIMIRRDDYLAEIQITVRSTRKTLHLFRDQFSVVDPVLYLRLDILDGILAYHSGDIGQAIMHLSSAENKYFQIKMAEVAHKGSASDGSIGVTGKRKLKGEERENSDRGGLEISQELPQPQPVPFSGRALCINTYYLKKLLADLIMHPPLQLNVWKQTSGKRRRSCDQGDGSAREKNIDASAGTPPQRDEEMEDVIGHQIVRYRAGCYATDLREEAEVIAEYLSLICLSTNQGATRKDRPSTIGVILLSLLSKLHDHVTQFHFRQRILLKSYFKCRNIYCSLYRS